MQMNVQARNATTRSPLGAITAPEPLVQSQPSAALPHETKEERNVNAAQQSGALRQPISDLAAIEGLAKVLTRASDDLLSGDVDSTSTAQSAFYGLDDAQAVCHRLAAKSGWWLDLETGEDVRTWPKKFMDLWISAKLMLSVTELAEAMEGHRKGLPDDKLPHRPMLEVEMADCIIRLMDLAGGLGLDLAGAIAEKLVFNQQRPDHKLENRAATGGKSV